MSQTQAAAGGRKTVILHIGRHKTGTTSLQEQLDRSADRLAREGMIYPRTGRAAPGVRGSIAHHELSGFLLSNPTSAAVAAVRKQLLDESDGFDVIVLSCEGFQNISDFGPLRALLDGMCIRVICYLRESLAYCISAYAQEIQTGPVVLDFGGFAAHFNAALNIEWFMKSWSEFADEVIWRLYDRRRMAGQSIVDDFAFTIGVPSLALDCVSDRNVTISGNLLAFKLLVNVLGLHQAHHKFILAKLAGEEPRFRGPLRVAPEEQKRIREGNPCNRILAGLFGEAPLLDFSHGNPVFDVETIDRDFSRIVAAFDEEPIRHHPVLARFAGARSD